MRIEIESIKKKLINVDFPYANVSFNSDKKTIEVSKL